MIIYFQQDQTLKEAALQSMSSMSSAQIVSLFHSQDQAAKEKALQSLTSLSSAQIVSATAIHNKATAAGLASLVQPVNYPGTAVSTKLSFFYSFNILAEV